jgi:leucyl aminopeptidase
MNITPSRQRIDSVQAQWLVLGIFEDDEGPPASSKGTALEAIIARLAGEKELTGSLGELTALYDVSGLQARQVMLVGLGTRGRFGPGMAFSAGFAVGKRLAGRHRESVALALPTSDEPGTVASALLEGVIVSTRGPGLRKSEANRHSFDSLTMILEPDAPELPDLALECLIRRAEIVGEAVNLARELVNTPPRDKSPAQLAERVARVAGEVGISVEVWDEERIAHERFGGLLGVAAGSDEPPRFVILEYRRGGDAPTIALVGKGVTFDSGGLSLKPTASMEDMKSDMTGAAVVAAAMQAVARLDLKVNVVGYLAMTENMTGGRAMKLGDVLTMRNGKTVEVMNTDAEGRLILADALSYAVEREPARVLDLATLTGACIVALGLKVAGLFSNDEAFRKDLIAASRKTGERVWRLPMDDDFKEQLKSSVADLKNVGGKWGGAVTAAKFLEQFVGSTPWIHLDIAGPSWCDTENSTRDAGATGCFVRTLVAYFERLSAPAASEPEASN